MNTASADEFNKLLALEKAHYYVSTYPNNLIVTRNTLDMMKLKKIQPESCCVIGEFFLLDYVNEDEVLGGYCPNAIIAIVTCTALTQARAEASLETKVAIALTLNGKPAPAPWAESAL